MPTPYEIAQGYAGQVEGPKQTLLNKFLSGDTAGMTSDQFAWCSRFVKQAAIKSGVDPKAISGATDMARSWLNVGQSVKAPAEGDIAVLPRGNPDGPYGHVGFYAGEGSKPGSIRLLAGNQGDAVSYREYPAEKVLGYRRLGAEGAFAAADDTPDILKSGYGRESGPGRPMPPMPDQSYASAAPPAAAAPTEQSWLSKSLGLSPSMDKGLGGIASAVGAFGKSQSGGDDKQLAELRQRAAQETNAALSEDEQRAQAAMKTVLSRRQRSAFG